LYTVNHVEKSCHIKSPWSEFVPRLSQFVNPIKSVGSQCVCQNFVRSLPMVEYQKIDIDIVTAVIGIF